MGEVKKINASTFPRKGAIFFESGALMEELHSSLISPLVAPPVAPTIVIH